MSDERNERTTRPSARCPRTWPHEPHGPWFTAEIVHPADIGAVSFDCPGVPVPSSPGVSA